ncbi:hypothetical protein H2248_010243 [Termitomyces sp. 'cryptogamus']|nr:hypothetical protein H2248_010243 [Termitomyces sp. 'cryptogamus']
MQEESVAQEKREISSTAVKPLSRTNEFVLLPLNALPNYDTTSPFIYYTSQS